MPCIHKLGLQRGEDENNYCFRINCGFGSRDPGAISRTTSC